MKHLLSILAVCLITFSINASWLYSTWAPWGQQSRHKVNTANGSGGDLATATFPQWNKPYLTFITTVNQAGLIGNLTGKTLTATVNVTGTGNPQFYFGGQGSWNNCPPPSNTRLYISSDPNAYDFANSSAGANPTAYWWSHSPWTIGLGSATLTDVFDPAQWSDGDGHFANYDTAHLAAFQSVVANVRQIGLAVSGGCFFDVGSSVVSGSGSAVFHLINFTAQ